MKTKYWINRNSIFLSWLVSYIILLVITILICGFAYFQSLAVIKKEINKAHISSLKQVKHVIDSKFQSIERICTELNVNPRVESMMFYKKKLKAAQRLNMIDIIKDIKSLKVAQEFIDSIYLYFFNSDYIITNKSTFNSYDYYNLYDKIDEVKYDEWKQKLIGIHRYDCDFVENIAQYNKRIKNICITQSLPMEDVDNRLATFVVKINEEKLNGILKDANWLDESSIFILNKNNKIISSCNNGNVCNVNYSDLLMVSNIFNKRYDNNNYVVSYVNSDINDWKYISILPQKVFLEKVKHTKHIIVLTIIICLITGIIIAILFSIKNYNPINNIINIFTESKLDKNKNYNEYKFIENTISNILLEDKKIKDRLKKQNQVLKNNFLRKLIKGRVDNNISVEDMCERFDIAYNTNQFAIMTYYIEDYSNILDKRDSLNDKETLNLAYFIFENIIEEVIGDKNNAYIVEIDNFLVCLINFKNDDKTENQAELLRIASVVKTFIERKVRITFVVSISKIHCLLDEINLAYQETQKALDYKMVLGINQIIVYERLKNINSHENDYQKYIDYKNKLENTIKSYDFKSAKYLINEMFTEVFDINKISIDMVKFRMVGLVETMMNIMWETYGKENSKIFDNIIIFDSLYNCKTVNQLHSNMNKLIDYMNEYNIEQSKSTEIHIIIKIKNIVTDNYDNINLNVAFIAELLEKDPTYLSRVFKKQTGKNLLEYIHKYRIKKAENLMLNSKYSMKKISKIVGYTNDVTFNRVFKKYRGISPGKYKKIKNES